MAVFNLRYSQLINNLNNSVEILYQRDTGLQEEKSASYYATSTTAG